MIDSVIPIGQDWTRTVSVVNSVGAAFNLTGWAPAAELRVAGVLVAVDASILSAVGGTITLDVPSADTVGLAPGCVGSLKVWVEQAGEKERVAYFVVRTEGVVEWPS